MNKFRCIFTAYTIAILLSSCVGQITIDKPVTILADENCIGSFDEFAFSTPRIDGPKQEVILPRDPWQLVDTLPEEAQKGKYQIAAIRSVADDVEIWLQQYRPSRNYQNAYVSSFHYLVYRIHTKDWRKIPARIEQTVLFVDKIFVTKDGSMWGQNVRDREEKISDYPILSRYDEMTGQFELDQGSPQIPNNSNLSFPYFNTVLYDTEGIFWVFAIRDAVYSYDPENQRVIRHAPLEDHQYIQRVSQSSDGNFFLQIDDKGEGYIFEMGQLFQYSPDTEEIRRVPLPKERWSNASSILSDSSGRLWWGVFGWREPSGEWNVLHPKMREFIDLNEREAFWRYYVPPKVLMASSDGRVWFSISRSEEWKTLRSGLAWYNPNTNEGCWFTSEGFNVAEDPQGSMWFTAEGYLYRLLK